MRYIFGLLSLSLPICYAQTCTQTFSPSSIGSSPYPGSNVNTAIQKGTAGTVLCFSAGTYGEIDVYGAHPSGIVTLMPAPGAAVNMGFFNLNGVSNVTITGFSGTSSSGGLLVQVAGQGNNSNITFSKNAMTSNGVNISNNALANANILITNNTFDGFTTSGESTRVNVVSNNACPNGITISNNDMGFGQADGIDVSGNSCQTQILNNTIHDILEQNCGGIHCDGFQDNGGGNGTHLKGNYFYNVSDCFLLDDGSSNTLIEDNVCRTSTSNSSYWMQFGGASKITLNHNTIISAAGSQYGNDHNSNPSSNVTFTNNIFPSQPSQNPGQPVSGTFLSDYNLCGSSCTGSHSMTGTPVYVGGSSPTTYAGYALASGSMGKVAANDAIDIGIAVTVTVQVTPPAFGSAIPQ